MPKCILNSHLSCIEDVRILPLVRNDWLKMDVVTTQAVKSITGNKTVL